MRAGAMLFHESSVGDDAGAQRGVIDIGSNTVRLVIFGGPARAGIVLHNEKVAAKLGKYVAETGRMQDRAMAFALTALVIGSAWLLLSAFWHQARAIIVRPLPVSLRDRLPLIDRVAVTPQPAA